MTKKLNFIANSKLSLFFVVCVVFALLFSHFYKLGNIPVGLYWDEIAMYLDAKTVSENFKDMHGNPALQAIFPSYGDYKLPMYIWLASLSFKILGTSEFALRFPSALTSILGAIVVYYLLRKMFALLDIKTTVKTVSLLGALIYLISPWTLLFSRTGFEGFIGQFFVSLGVLCLFLSKENKRWLIGATVCGVAGLYSYFSVRFVWPVVALSFWGCFEGVPVLVMPTSIGKKIQMCFESFLPFLVSLMIWIIGLLPLYLSPFYSASQQFRLSTTSLLDPTLFVIESNMYREASGNNLLSRVAYNSKLLQLKAILHNYADHINLNYLFFTGDSNLRHGTGRSGLFYVWCLPLFLFGLYILGKRKLSALFFLLIWWMIALLPASIPTETPHSLRSLNALTPLVIIISFGSYSVIDWYQRVSNNKIKQLFFLITVTFVTQQFVLFEVDYFSLYPARSAKDWQQGYKQIVEAIGTDYNKYEQIWIDPSDDRFFLWYLAYGPFSPEEIQEGLRDQSIVKEWKNTRFQSYQGDSIVGTPRPFVIVKKAGELQFIPDREIIITDENGQPKFSVGFYEKKI